jgi:DNA end-binding protein Ku
MARAMWKASLRAGNQELLPVKLYSAVEDRAIHFRLLHAKDHVPVTQRMVDPNTEEEVPDDEVQRGLEVEEGVFVILHPEELASAEPEASRDIEITRFVPREAVDPGWYRRPYMLGPDGQSEDYFALASALEETGRVGIARWVMRGTAYSGVLAPHEGRLALIAMKPAEEVVPISQLTQPGGPPLQKLERQLAEQLISALDASFDPKTLHDDYRERVRKFIAAKAKGKTVQFKEAAAPPATRDLSRALKESLQAAKERRIA